MLVKIKRKAKLLLAVKKQPLNSQTEAEIMSEGPKTEGFMGKACLEGRACQKGVESLHLLRARFLRQKPTSCWRACLHKRKKPEKYKGTGYGTAREIKAIVEVGSKELQA